MRRTELLQEIRKMRFEEVCEGWNAGRLMQSKATRLLGIPKDMFANFAWDVV